MVEAARKYNRIVQHGTQCRSSEKIREGIQKLKEGVIGRVYMARGIAFKRRAGGRNDLAPVPKGMHWDLWLGPAPEAPYNRLAVDRWRFLKEYGNGEIGDQGVHQLDIIRWGLGLDTHPTKVQSMGGNLVHKDDEDTPSNQIFACQYDNRNLLVQFETRQWYTNSEAGHGNRVSVRRSSKRGGRDFSGHGRIHDHPRLLELLRLPWSGSQARPQRQRARQSDDGHGSFPQLDCGDAQPQARRLAARRSRKGIVRRRWPIWPISPIALAER